MHFARPLFAYSKRYPDFLPPSSSDMVWFWGVESVVVGDRVQVYGGVSAGDAFYLVAMGGFKVRFE